MTKKAEEYGFDEERTFGVEIEFLRGTSRHEVKRKMEQKGINKISIGHYGHSAPEGYWKIEKDSSCGYELITPILKGTEGLDKLEKALDALNEAGAEVNVNCGVHVHHGAEDFTTRTFKNLLRFYTKFEEVINYLVAPSRRNFQNTYTKSLRPARELNLKDTFDQIKEARNIQDLHELYHNDRYRHINLEAYRDKGTVEFRQHNGSTDPEKIINWVKLTQAFIQRAQRSENTYISWRGKQTIDVLLSYREIKYMDNDKAIRDFYKERYEYFTTREEEGYISWNDFRQTA